MWTNNGTESLYLYPRYALPVDPTAGVMGNAHALWFASNGERGTAPTEPEMLRAFELMRSAAGQRQEERDPHRAGDLEARGRAAMGHRPGRPVARLHGRARGQ